MNSSNKNIFLLIAFLVSVHAAFFIYAYRSGNIYLAKDSVEYLQQAKNLKQHASWYAGDWSKPYDEYLQTRRPPLYGIFIFLAKLIFNSDFFVCLIQCVLSVLNFILVMKLIGLVKHQRQTNYRIAALLLFFPTQFIYANMIMADVLFQYALLNGFYYFILFLNEKRTKHFLYFQIAIVAALLIKPVFYLFWIPNLLFSIYLFRKNILKWSHVLFNLIPAAVVLLFCVYNYHKTNYFHYSSVNQTYAVNYAAYLSVIDEKSGSEANQKIDSMLVQARKTGNFHDYSIYVEHESRKIIATNIISFSLLQVKGIAEFFLDHGRWDIHAFVHGTDKQQTNGILFHYRINGISGVFNYLKSFRVLFILYLVIITFVNLIISISFFAFLYNKDVNSYIRIAAALLVFYLAVVTGLIGCSRYRMAVYPILLFAFPFGVPYLKSKFTFLQKLNFTL